MLLTLAVFTALLFAFGLGPVLLQTVTNPLDTATRALAAAFSITVGLNLVFAPLLWLAQRWGWQGHAAELDRRLRHLDAEIAQFHRHAQGSLGLSVASQTPP